MNDNESIVHYNRRTWLNNDNTSSTGSVVCCHSTVKYPEDKESYESIFCEIADCHVKARLHKTQFETRKQFLNKLKYLRLELSRFIDHLEEYENHPE